MVKLPGVVCAWEWGHVVVCFNGVARRIPIKQKPGPTTKVVTPAFYAAMYARLCVVAHAHGYALAIHGTMTRDCDLIAVPWVPEAVDADTLIAAFAALLGKELEYVGSDKVKAEVVPNAKPHGRLAWSIHLLGGNEYFDVSVMPRLLVP